MEVKIKKLSQDAILPRYATDGSGCFDLFYKEDYEEEFDLVLEVSTGLSFEIPSGYVMLVFSRSGHGFKHDVRLSNCVGVIDSDYRGEVKVKLRGDDYNNLDFKYGDAVAQAMIVPVPKVSFIEVQTLSETARGEGGFGSTDNK